MASTDLIQLTLSEWKAIGLDKRKPEIDKQALQMYDNEERSAKARKNLATATKGEPLSCASCENVPFLCILCSTRIHYGLVFDIELKKLNNDEKLQQMGTVFRSYQEVLHCVSTRFFASRISLPYDPNVVQTRPSHLWIFTF
jgi:hypothetical protein